MIKSFFALAGATMLLTTAALSPQSVEGHIEKLQKAKSLQATISVQLVGGSPTEYKVAFSKPDKSKITSEEFYESTDGKQTITYNKEDKNYYTKPYELADLQKFLMVPEFGGWSPFFIGETEKHMTIARTGKAKKVRNVECTAYAITLENKDTIEAYVENATGLMRGYTHTHEDKQWIVWATKLELGSDPLPEDTFAFADPSKLKEVKEMTAAADYATVAKILNSNCLPCHGENRADGLDIRTYDSLMASGKVKPGDSAGSSIVRAIKSTRRPMPPRPGKPLSAEDQATIAAWIDAGAKQ